MSKSSSRTVFERREFALSAIGNSQFDRSWLAGRFDRILIMIAFGALTYYSKRVGELSHSYWLVVATGAAIAGITWIALHWIETAQSKSLSMGGQINSAKDEEFDLDDGLKIVGYALISGILIGAAYVIYAGYRDAFSTHDYTYAGWSGMIFFGVASELYTRASGWVARRKEPRL